MVFLKLFNEEKKMKKILVFLVVVFVVFGLSLFAGGGKEPKAEEKAMLEKANNFTLSHCSFCSVTDHSLILPV